MSVAVVTPWTDHLELADDYMAAIAAGPAPDELIVVDNRSRPRLDFAHTRLPVNKGFSGGCNAGLAAATSDVVVFLNNDIALSWVGWLDKLVAAVRPGVLAGPLRTDKHANVDGRVMPYIDGWCLAGMREDLLDLGGFDEQLAEPAYYSDNLLCLEARAQGFRLLDIHPGLVHKGGQTAGPLLGQSLAVTLQNRERYLARARTLLQPVHA